MLEKKALQTIKEYKMLQPGDTVLAGVSGGADSISLLYLLYNLKAELGLSSIYIGHFNHMLRKGESDIDQRYVEDQAKKLGLICLTDSKDVAAYAAKNKLSIEDAARRLRYAFYDETAIKTNSNKIVLGHTADDSVETFLMRLLRGAGLKGLTGIPPVRGNIVRPLIKIWRKEIDQYIASLKLVPRIDHTNYESKYLRNRVRLKLIPQLKIYNLNIKEILLQTVLLLTEDYLYMESKTKGAIEDVTISKKENSIELDAKKLRGLEPPIERHLLRTAVEKVKGNLAELTFSHIHDVIKNIDQTERWELHLPDSIFVSGNKNSLIISKDKPKELEKVAYLYNLTVPGEIIIKEAGLKISSSILDAPPEGFEESRDTAYLDFEQVGKKITIRSRKDGDRFYPLGMNGAKKIQDYFVDQKVPQEQRDLIPICEGGGRIIWVVGLRIDERVKIGRKTKKAIKLTSSKI
ncbi:MAG: tRNA(Ile)-lysidine synthase [Candidatus Saganbacteria bacterium]|uniref:tRNA(Ile)-lysidine synthase n=1 Tax=Candidatus Saganbacteria bacterium TaxID=2575572 RepID=A0A833L0A7_UNCSA|nr:MAG: tRNA(Ile)-lysidine synthase [Candidatus Saganbacteria bacterium]